MIMILLSSLSLGSRENKIALAVTSIVPRNFSSCTEVAVSLNLAPLFAAQKNVPAHFFVFEENVQKKVKSM